MAYSLKLSDFITQSYLLATGKATPPLAGTPKYAKLVTLANMYTQKWAAEEGVDWASLRSDFTIGTISATNTYDLDSDIGKVSDQEGDYVRVFHADGKGESDYTIVPVSRLFDGEMQRQHGDNRLCAVSGASLVFSKAFTTSDAQYGGTIHVPGYVIPDTLVNPNDLIQVDNPNWLVEICAAEYVRTDLTRQAQYPNLIAMAKDTMTSMIAQNDTQSEYAYTGGWSASGATWS